MNSTILLLIIILILGGIIGFFILQDNETEPIKTEPINYLPKINKMVNSNSNSNFNSNFNLNVCDFLFEMFNDYIQMSNLLKTIDYQFPFIVRNDFEIDDKQLYNSLLHIFVLFIAKKIYKINYEFDVKLKPVIDILENVYNKIKKLHKNSYNTIKNKYPEYYTILKGIDYDEDLDKYTKSKMGVWVTAFPRENINFNDNTINPFNFPWTDYYRNYDFVRNYEERMTDILNTYIKKDNILLSDDLLDLLLFMSKVFRICDFDNNQLMQLNTQIIKIFGERQFFWDVILNLRMIYTNNPEEMGDIVSRLKHYKINMFK